jgi:Na+:H+ antiporter
MHLFNLLSIIITAAAFIAYINNRFIRMPTTIAIMSGSLLLSLFIIVMRQVGFTEFENHIYHVLSLFDFHELLMNGMLSFLLFAGALHIDLGALQDARYEIAALACLGTIASAALVGVSTYFLLQWMGSPLSLTLCLLFGALISPTDPIAVLAIFKQVGADKKLNVTVSGESLFNDGVGIVLFLVLYALAFQHTATSFKDVILLFCREAVGGILYGVLLGMLAHRLIKPVDDYNVEILITLAVATGGYVLGNYLHLSGPLAMVSAGIFIGNKGRQYDVDEKTRRNLDNFWELMDEMLNAVLFFLIGLELVVLSHETTQLVVSLLAIPLVLGIRYLTVQAIMWPFTLFKTYTPYFRTILVWGGLRGGLAVALALAIPDVPGRSLILSMTYAIVVFSVIVQGLTVKPLVQLAKQ